MMTDLSTEHLTQTIGSWIENHKGTTLGKVEDIKFDNKRHIPIYLILCCTELIGNSNRYFAIPTIPSLIRINQEGGITIRLDINVLQIVMGVPAQQCPQIDPEISGSVFELYEYEETKLSG